MKAMNSFLLAQTSRLSPIQESVKKQFEEGGSLRTALIVLGVLVAVVLVAGFIGWIQRPPNPRNKENPRKLFHRLLHQLPLSHRQRRLLWGMAKDLRLPNPTLLLLSPGYFATCVDQWKARSTRRPRKRQPTGTVLLEQIRVAVFPKAPTPASRNAANNRRHKSIFTVVPMSDRVIR